MAEIHPDVQNALADAFAATADGGRVVFLDAGGAVLFTLTGLAFNPAADGAVSVAGLPLDVEVANTGTATTFEIRNSLSVMRLRGTVSATGEGGEAQMPSPLVTVGEKTEISSIVVTMPAGTAAVG